MHEDWQELDKIIKLLPIRECSDKEVELVLQRICKETDEASRSIKFVDYKEHRSDMTRKYKRTIGDIYSLCVQNKCQNCCISKWCNYYRSVAQEAEKHREGFKYADFFCGAGGLSLGFHNAGYKLSLANDIQKCCIDTISFNHPEVPEKHIVAGDINEVINNIEELSRYNQVDVVAGGPPCQGFSMANRQRIIDDPRNHLYKSFIKAINILKPKFFVMENVRGMLGVKEQIIQDFNNIGYSATAYILNAKDFGIPQNRERVIFIGNRLGIDNELVFTEIFKIGRTSKKTSLIDAINDLPSLQAKTIPNHTEVEDIKSGYTIALKHDGIESDYIKLLNNGQNNAFLFNHKARYNNERDIEIFSRLNPGDNSADPKIADIMPYKRREKIFKDKYYKLEMDKPCKTITAHMKFDCNMYIHPMQSRGLTPREAARVQSYPDDYFFRGSYTKTYMQVGNSVPPLLGQAIAFAIKKYLEEV